MMRTQELFGSTVRDLIEKGDPGESLSFEIAVEGVGKVLVLLKEISFTEGEVKARLSNEGRFLNFSALFFTARREGGSRLVDTQWLQFCCQSVAPMFFDVFRHREQMMMPFAPKVSSLYWRESALGTKDKTYFPPWDESNIGDGSRAIRSTVTLSVDLRKSTFCMDQAESKAEFGRWLDRLVHCIVETCHSHGGVFDKFTGDGGLMHFLDGECKFAFGKTAIESAFDCASELCSRVEGMLPALRRNLRNNSARLGAGIAIAASEGFWSIDHRGNPIVVGHGVVDACRICDGTQPKSIRMSNYAHGLLAEANSLKASLFQEVDLGETKEWNASMRLRVWEMFAG
jgi:class 3 adenylate cyclase